MKELRDLKDLTIHDGHPISDERLSQTGPALNTIKSEFRNNAPVQRAFLFLKDVPRFSQADSGPLRAVHLSRHKWPVGSVN